MKYTVWINNGRATVIPFNHGGFKTTDDALEHVRELGHDVEYARRALRREEQWAKFDALSTRQKIVAFLFNLTAFPFDSSAAKLQAATLAILTMGTVVLIGKLVGH